MTHSLTTRILVTAGLVLVAFLGLTVMALDIAFRSAGERAVNDRLQVQSLALISAADLDADGQLVLPDQLPEARFSNPGSGLYAQIYDHNVETVWRSPSTVGIALLPPPELEPGARRFEHGVISDGTEVFQFGHTVVWDAGDEALPPRTFHFAVAETLAPYRAQVARYRANLFGWFGVLFAALIAAQLLILRRMLRPLRDIAGEVAAVEAGRQDTVRDTYPRELQRLARNLNALIRNERGHLQRYRDTLGDLAHSLKTPLAVMRCAVGEPPGPQRDATISQQLTRMDEIVRYQLRQAIAAGGGTFGRVLPVAPHVREVLLSLSKVYAARELVFEPALDEAASFRGDRIELLEILGNLLDNACKWARSTVRVSVMASGDGFTATVDDDGPGIPAAGREAVLKRGIRGDETVAGQGIGLAVVRGVVDRHGGTLALAESELGGLKATVRVQ